MTVCVRCVLLSGLVGLLIHQLQQLVHVHTVNGAGLLHSLADGKEGQPKQCIPMEKKMGAV